MTSWLQICVPKNQNKSNDVMTTDKGTMCSMYTMTPWGGTLAPVYTIPPNRLGQNRNNKN